MVKLGLQCFIYIQGVVSRLFLQLIRVDCTKQFLFRNAWKSSVKKVFDVFEVTQLMA